MVAAVAAPLRSHVFKANVPEELPDAVPQCAVDRDVHFLDAGVDPGVHARFDKHVTDPKVAIVVVHEQGRQLYPIPPLVGADRCSGELCADQRDVALRFALAQFVGPPIQPRCTARVQGGHVLDQQPHERLGVAFFKSAHQYLRRDVAAGRMRHNCTIRTQDRVSQQSGSFLS